MADEPTTDEQPINRLTDMEVVEVSLVDRAANKRRFIVVKRSKAMAKKKGSAGNQQVDTSDNTDLAATADDETGDDTGDGETDDADTDEPAGDAGDSATAGAAGAAGGDAGAAAGAASATPAAATPGTEGATVDAAALTKAVVGMAEAVQDLANVVDGITDRVNAIETGGKKPTAKAAVVASADEGDDDELDGDEEEEKPAPPPKTRKKTAKASPVTTKLSKVRTALGLNPPPRGGDETLSAINKALQGIATDLTSVKSGLADQKTRLSRLEKQTGLPSSLPTDGGSKPKTRGVSWPMDINSPVDRDYVAKDVSFHQ